QVDLHARPLNEALDFLLKEKNIRYDLKRDRVIVLEKATPVAANAPAVQTQQTITGRVTGADGAVAGASVRVRGTNRGTATDGQGNCRIEATPEEVLVFTAVGYQEQAVTIGGQSVVNITLQAVSQDMDEVVVIGYGTVRKRDLTGS